MQMFKKIASGKYIYLLCLLLVIATVIPFNFSTMNGDYSQWIIPYFSGAENTSWFGQWQYSIAEQEAFLNANNNTKMRWPFQRYDKEELNNYDYNDIGYLYIVKIAKLLFGFLPGILAVMVLQIVLHLVACFFFLFCIKKLNWPYYCKYIFIFAYAVNPLILYFVTSPFYYSWQILPSILWLSFLVFPALRASYKFLAVIAFIGFLSFLIRPTTVVPIGALFCTVVILKNWKLLVPALVVFLCFFIMVFPSVTSKLPWHPMYVGLGAYGGFEVTSLSDNHSYDYYYSKTGETIQTSIPGASWNDKTLRAEFYKVIRARYLELAKEKPLLVLRNSLLNILQSVSLGHRPSNNLINIVSIVIGLIVLFFILSGKYYLIAIALLSTALGYTLYFPPIPAYNFGMYILNVYAVIVFSFPLFSKLTQRRKK